MQQKSPITFSDLVSNLANEYLQLMKGRLGFFSSEQDKETVRHLEEFLKIQLTVEEILNQFKSTSKAFLDDELKKLSQAFVSRVTNRGISVQNETYNYK